ncbi:hypothetical protein BC830DRAFT_245978 [Chytriomyces sp. MP71]|nr:hypothetical protein BC830DRAFT_245978 [Chytriomyces sp. MP71]
MANHAAYNSFAGPAGHRQIPFTPSQSIAAVSSTLAPEEGKSSATQEVSNAPTSALEPSTPPVTSNPKYTPDQHMVEKAKRAISLISQKGPGGVRVIPYAAPSLAPVATSSSASESKSSRSPTRLSISSQQAKTVAPLTSPTSTATIRVQEPLRPDRRNRTPSPAKKVQSAPTPVVVVTPKAVPVYIPRPILTTIPSRLIVKLVSPVPVYVAKPIFVRKGGVAHLARGKSPARTKEAPKEVKSRSKTPEPAIKGSPIYLPNPVFTKMSSRPLVKPKTVPVYVPKPFFVTKRGRSPSPAKASKFLATMTPVAAPSSALRVTAEEFVPFGSSDSPTDHALRVTAQEFTPMSPDIDTHGNGTVSSGHSSPPFFGGDPNEAYNPYATPSGVYAPVSMGFGIQASPPIGLDPSAAAWDPMTAYMYTVDGQYIPAAQMFPVVDAFGLPLPGPGALLFESVDSLHSGEDGVQKGVMSAAEKRNQHRTSRHSSGASKASAKSGVGVGQAGKKKGGKTGVNGLAPGSGPLPHTPTLADFIKVDKKRGSVEVVEKVVPGKSGAGSPSASAGSIGSDFERGPTALAKLEGAVRCPDGTFCQNQDTCPYFHPLEICRFYPKCRSGNACYYIHETGSR